VVAILKLDSADLKDVLIRVLVTLGWLGYPCAAVTIWVSVKMLRWREKIYNAEMERNVEAKKVLIQERLALPLQSSDFKK